MGLHDMSFSEALECMKRGMKVKRKHWGGYWFIPKRVLVSDNGFAHEVNPTIMACLKNAGGYIQATPYMEDLLAEDWEIVE
jgi:hypothetical protein